MDPMIARPKEQTTEQPVKLNDGKPTPAIEPAKPKAKPTRKLKMPKIKLPNMNKTGLKDLLSKKVTLIVTGVVVVVIAAIIIVVNVMAPIHITKIETARALSSRTEDAPVKSQFAEREPVMLRFEYNGANVGNAVRFEVKDSEGQVVKSGTTTVLRATNDDSASGQRFISIVNTPSTALPVGKYNAVLIYGDRTVGNISFEIITGE